MWATVFAIILIWTFVSALAAGAVGSLILALAASVGGAFIGMALKWDDQGLWFALMAGPSLLLMILLSSAILDRLERFRDRRHRFGSSFNPEQR
jgi:hypothetical protein